MNCGIILAAGNGTRFGASKPKQFLQVNRKPLIYYSLSSFVDSKELDLIVLVVSSTFISYTNSIIARYFRANAPRIVICEGGSTRQESLYKGILAAVNQNNSSTENLKIVSHCGARPLIPCEIISDHLKLLETGLTINTVKKVYDTMIWQEDTSSAPNYVDRDKLFTVLTPQSFYASDFLSAYEHFGVAEASKYTCACSLLNAHGIKNKLYITNHPIHKVTVQSDLEIIKSQLNKYGQKDL